MLATIWASSVTASGCAWRPGAQDPPQPAAYASYDCGCSRVAEALLTVAVGNRGAVTVEDALAEPSLGAG